MRQALAPVARVVGEALFLLLAGLNSLMLLFIGGMSCDESCTNYRGEGNPNHDSWKVTADAWQWDLIGWLGLASVACAVGAVIAARLNKEHTGLALLGAAIVSAMAGWGLATA